ncbi:MAG: type II toxin-antitoxin system prevent-host-death family antitoxin [Pseudomonadota bacterium]
MQMPVAEAKTHLAELIRRAEAGEEIELTRYGRPVARLTAPKLPSTGGLIGCMAGAFPSPELGQGDEEVEAMLAGGSILPK